MNFHQYRYQDPDETERLATALRKLLPGHKVKVVSQEEADHHVFTPSEVPFYAHDAETPPLLTYEELDAIAKLPPRDAVRKLMAAILSGRSLPEGRRDTKTPRHGT